MFHKMKRYAAVLVAAVVLTGTAGLGTASAATAAARPPAPHCSVWSTYGRDCNCPRGWQVRWLPWWELWKTPICIRKR